MWAACFLRGSQPSFSVFRARATGFEGACWEGRKPHLHEPVYQDSPVISNNVVLMATRAP